MIRAAREALFRDFQTEFGQWGHKQSHKSRPCREAPVRNAVVVVVRHRPNEAQGQAVEGDLDGGGGVE